MGKLKIVNGMQEIGEVFQEIERVIEEAGNCR
jgi:hypothetical protein